MLIFYYLLHLNGGEEKPVFADFFLDFNANTLILISMEVTTKTVNYDFNSILKPLVSPFLYYFIVIIQAFIK